MNLFSDWSMCDDVITIIHIRYPAKSVENVCVDNGSALFAPRTITAWHVSLNEQEEGNFVRLLCIKRSECAASTRNRMREH